MAMRSFCRVNTCRSFLISYEIPLEFTYEIKSLPGGMRIECGLCSGNTEQIYKSGLIIYIRKIKCGGETYEK